MKLMKVIYIAFLILISLTSCTRLILGVKPAKVETPETIIASAVELGIDTNYLYLFNRDTVYSKPYESQFIANRYNVLNKNLILMRNPIACHTGLFDLLLNANQATLDSLMNKSADPENPKRVLPHPRMMPLTGTLEQIADDVNSEKYDFYLIYWWTNALSRYTKRDLKKIEKLKADPRYKVRVYYMNVDLMDMWFESPEFVGKRLRVRPVLVR